MVGYALSAQLTNPDGGIIRPGVMGVRWTTGGPKCMEVPDWQVHEYNEDFYILRESGCTHYEKPFLYLIFGRDKALLEDTGAGDAEPRGIVKTVIGRWLKMKKRQSIPLLVMHSHAHGDHSAGDSQFRGQPDIELVPATVPALQQAFGITKWPDNIGRSIWATVYWMCFRFPAIKPLRWRSTTAKQASCSPATTCIRADYTYPIGLLSPPARSVWWISQGIAS